MKTVFSFAIALVLACAPVAFAKDAQGIWTVVLTNKQSAEFQEQKSQKKHTGFAVSPDGAWGRSHGFASKDKAAARAMSFCRSFMRKGQRDCILFAVDGTIVAPAVVKTKTVTALYKPINAKTAPAVFGYAPGAFKGNKDAAKAAYNAFEKNPALRNSMARDANLERLLTNRTLMTKTSRPFLLWFSPNGGEQNGVANSGILVSYFKSWIATPDGLVCLFDARWDNGNPIGNRCLYIDSIENGQVRFTWASSINKKRKAMLLAGDARFAAAR
ncbi:hypothetical protein [Shimia abyssi]|uniref:DUF4189 domain-containing protein n=1 Tax=Shimia abyssi TaxID=1662395 RepID=A0A2P8FA70_9RHOB|nr:hypothetical protein [Shimia abyssi]PSL18627.1 hypothetical protein CLV88_10912 [Shimia abyssi]